MGKLWKSFIQLLLLARMKNDEIISVGARNWNRNRVRGRTACRSCLIAPHQMCAVAELPA